MMESVGTVLVIGGVGLYAFGCYPTKMNYRVVGAIEQEAGDTLLSKVQSRLQGIEWNNVSVVNQSRFHINCWQFQRSAIASRLRITQSPAVVCLSTEGLGEPSPTDRYVTVVKNLSSPLFEKKENQTNRQVRTTSEPFELNDRTVARLQIHSNDRLDVTLSMDGWNQYQKWIMNQSGDYFLGIQLDGMIYGLADQKSVLDRQLRFQWGGKGNYSLETIQAAIRGPSFESELELLD